MDNLNSIISICFLSREIWAITKNVPCDASLQTLDLRRLWLFPILALRVQIFPFLLKRLNRRSIFSTCFGKMFVLGRKFRNLLIERLHWTFVYFINHFFFVIFLSSLFQRPLGFLRLDLSGIEKEFAFLRLKYTYVFMVLRRLSSYRSTVFCSTCTT